MVEPIFLSKANKPGPGELKKTLGKTFSLWDDIIKYVFESEKKAISLWNYSGPKYGWGFRIKDSKRVLIYMLPGKDFFTVSFVYGKQATRDALNSNIPEEFKKIINESKVYAEGRGFRLEVGNKKILGDIKKIIDFKLKNRN